MFAEEKILIGCNENQNVFLLPKLANRHGLIAGATGTGKTVTLNDLLLEVGVNAARYFFAFSVSPRFR